MSQVPTALADNPRFEDSSANGSASKTSASSPSEPHRRTRRDHASETAEDYVEAVAEIIAEAQHCRLNDLAKKFAVSHVTANRIVGRLKKEGLLESEPYQPIRLTAKGKRLAAKCRARHDIVYRFLIAIGVDPKTAAIDTEGIEHHVSPATLRRFQEIGRRRQRKSS